MMLSSVLVVKNKRKEKLKMKQPPHRIFVEKPITALKEGIP